METEAPAQAQAPQMQPKEIVETIEKVTRFESEFATEKESNAKELKALNEKVEAQSKLIKDMFLLIEQLGNEDAANAAETTKNVFRKKTLKELRESFRAQLYK